MGFAGRWGARPERVKIEEVAAAGDVDGLLRLAGDAGPRGMAAAASRLAAMGPREAGPAVRTAVRDGSDRTRCVALRALYEWRDAISLAEAVFWLPAEGAARGLALGALARLGDPESAPVLAGSLGAGTAQERLAEREVALVLRLCRPSVGGAALARVLEVLAEAFEVGDEGIARRAESFLIWLGDDAVTTVTALAQSGIAPDRAVWVLGQIGGASVVDQLIEAVGHPRAPTREAACVALGELRDPVAVETLISATRDRDHDVRVAAAAALDRMGTVAVLAGLSTLVQGLRRASSATHNGADDGQNGAGHESGKARARTRPR